MSRWIAGYTFVFLAVFVWNTLQLPFDAKAISHVAGCALLLLAIPATAGGFAAGLRNLRRPLRIFDYRFQSGMNAAARGIGGGLLTIVLAAVFAGFMELPSFYPPVEARGVECYFMILSAFLGARASLLFARPIRPGRCVRCDYDLRMSIEYGRCPECGTSI